MPASFAADTIASFTITQNDDFDIALFSGLTFSDKAIITSTPEPTSLAGVGVMAFAAARQRSAR